MRGGLRKYLRTIVIVAVLLLGTGEAYAHKEFVHQYLAIQAYRLLEQRYPGIADSPMRPHLGGQEGDCGGDPFDSGLITAGAYREDCEDPVFHYGDLVAPLDEAYVSVSHFWDADAGDNSTLEICNLTCGRYRNAYQKSLRYILPGTYGRWTAKLSWPIGQANFNMPGGGSTWILQYGQVGFEYDDLTTFYRDGICRITGYLDVTGKWQTASTVPDRLPVEVVAPAHVRDRITWEVIGRIVHLLGDLGVPAHSHNDIHPPFWWNNEPADIYEEEMGRLYTAWDHLDAAGQGGVLDPYAAVRSGGTESYLRYLFYTTSQVADRFPSNDADGDGNYDVTWNGDDYSALDILSSVTVPFTDRDRFHPETAEYAFVFSMRAIAGLYLWFASESGIMNRFTVRNGFGDGHLLVDDKPYVSPVTLVRYAGSGVRLEAPAQDFTDPSTRRNYRMIFREWTCELPSGERSASDQNPWETELPGGSVLTAGYSRQVTLSLTKPRHMEDGDGAYYLVNGTNRGSAWTWTSMVEDRETVAVEMIVPPGSAFLGWSDGDPENPRTLTPEDHLEIHGLHKFHLRSRPGSAIPGNWRRSTVAPGPDGEILLLVYESGGNIFYSSSVDGQLWKDEELVNDGTGRASSPSIGYSAGSPEEGPVTFIVWVERPSAGDGYNVMGRAKSLEDGRWAQIIDHSASGFRPDREPEPAVADKFILWKGPQGLAVKEFSGIRAMAVPGTDPGCSSPALDVADETKSECVITWKDGSGNIAVVRGIPSEGTWSETAIAAVRDPGTEISAPAVAMDGAGLAYIAWSSGSSNRWKTTYRISDRENALRPPETFSGCDIATVLPVVPALTHYRDDDSGRRDIDIYVPVPGSGLLGTLLIRGGRKIGPIVSAMDGAGWSFPFSGRKTLPWYLIVAPAGDMDTYLLRNGANLPRQPAPPLSPTPAFPADGSVIAGPSATLTWNCMPDALRYHVQVAVDGEFSTRIVDAEGVDGDHVSIGGLTPGSRYYWRVSALNEAGEGSFSNSTSFSIQTAPDPPVLTGTTVVIGGTRFPSLSWTSSPGATGYRLERFICMDAADCGMSGSYMPIYRGSSRSFVDKSTPVGSKTSTGKVKYRVIAGRYSSESPPSNVVSYGIAGLIASGNRAVNPGEEGLPARTEIGPNFPNPFNPKTVIPYQLSTAGHVKITVYNILGVSIGVLEEAEKGPGYYRVEWDASDRPSGVYVIEMAFQDAGAAGISRLRRKVLCVN